MPTVAILLRTGPQRFEFLFEDAFAVDFRLDERFELDDLCEGMPSVWATTRVRETTHLLVQRLHIRLRFPLDRLEFEP